WLFGTVLWNGYWPAWPWAVAPQETAGPGWPSIEVRWIQGAITLALLSLSLVGSGVAVKQTIQRSHISDQRLNFLRFPIVLAAATIMLMAFGAAGWGGYASRCAGTAFHSHNGLMGSSILLSWLGSVVLFAAASATAVRSAYS